MATSGHSLEFLKLAFPELDFVRSASLKVKYPARGSMALKMARSAPGFLTEIYHEHHQLEQMIEEYNIDAVISDNRFGFWSNRVHTVYLTHQVVILMPRGLKAIEPLSYRAHRRIIRRYNSCWIPDSGGKTNLSGDLSHKFKKPGNATYIGPLSRFMDYDHVLTERDDRFTFDLVAIVSGPEPQRSIFEHIVRRESDKHPGMKVALLQGIPENSELTDIHDRLAVYSHLPDHHIAALVKNAGTVVCRPGYSSIMDLVFLRKKATLIPTPGQTEQEYLGKYLAEKRWFYCIPQHRLSFENIAITNEKETIPLPVFEENDPLEKQIDLLLKSIG